MQSKSIDNAQTMHSQPWTRSLALQSRLALLRVYCELAGVMLPSVTVEYKDIRVEADALVGSAGVPSLFNVARHFVLVPTLCFQHA